MSDEPKKDEPEVEDGPKGEEEFDFTQFPSQRPQIDFTDLAKPLGGFSFDFMIPATFLPGSPDLFTVKANGCAVKDLLQRGLDEMLNFDPEAAGLGDHAEEWAVMREALRSEAEVDAVVSDALAVFKENLRAVAVDTFDLVFGLSLAWALLPGIERAISSSFRYSFLVGMLNRNMEQMTARVLAIRAEVERILDERSAVSVDVENEEAPAS